MANESFTDRQKTAIAILLAFGGGAALDRVAVPAAASAQAAPSVELSRATVFYAPAEKDLGGIGVEICGRAFLPDAGPDASEIIVEQGCVDSRNPDLRAALIANPQAAKTCLLGATTLWAAIKKVPFDGGQ